MLTDSVEEVPIKFHGRTSSVQFFHELLFMLVQAPHLAISKTPSRSEPPSAQAIGEDLEVADLRSRLDPSLIQLPLASFSRKLRKFRELSPGELRELIASFLRQGLSLEFLKDLYPLGETTVPTELRSVRRADPTIAERDITFDKFTSAPQERLGIEVSS